eukprot:COSAG01_NODE_46211_length_402_cov_0.676568_1_plen_64_part_00
MAFAAAATTVAVNTRAANERGVTRATIATRADFAIMCTTTATSAPSRAMAARATTASSRTEDY